MWYIYTMEYYSAIKHEIMPLAATWVDIEIIILSKPDRETQISYDIAYMWNLNLKKIQMYFFPKQKETHRHRKQTYGYQKGREEGSKERRKRSELTKY